MLDNRYEVLLSLKDKCGQRHEGDRICLGARARRGASEPSSKLRQLSGDRTFLTVQKCTYIGMSNHPYMLLTFERHEFVSL